MKKLEFDGKTYELKKLKQSTISNISYLTVIDKSISNAKNRYQKLTSLREFCETELKKEVLSVKAGISYEE